MVFTQVGACGYRVPSLIFKELVPLPQLSTPRRLPPVASRCFCLLPVLLPQLSAPQRLPPVACRCFCLLLVLLPQLSAPRRLLPVASCLWLPSRFDFGSTAVASCLLHLCVQNMAVLMSNFMSDFLSDFFDGIFSYLFIKKWAGARNPTKNPT